MAGNVKALYFQTYRNLIRAADLSVSNDYARKLLKDYYKQEFRRYRNIKDKEEAYYHLSRAHMCITGLSQVAEEKFRSLFENDPEMLSQLNARSRE